jgi:hypothetical protein
MSSTTIYITNKCYGDNFGSQYHYLIAILLTCYASGYEFIYNKLTQIENNDLDYIERMENLMNLRPHFTPFGDESLNNAFITIYDMTVKHVMNSNIDYYAKDTHLLKIKEMFWANKDRTNVFDNNGKTNVAVHISNATPIDSIQRLRDEYNILSENGNLIFHIYSDDSTSMDLFQSYIADDIIIHMNEDIESIFISMVAADMLITSNSYLSYTAALLSDGIIYYHSNENPPRNAWISL